MFALILVSVPIPTPIALDSITVERARSLHGKCVVATFLVAKPSYTVLGRTVTGAADRDDGAERGAVMPGLRYDFDVGHRTSVVGKMRVVEHPPAFVNGQWVPAWVEIRVEG